jgi:hypothetical protein
MTPEEEIQYLKSEIEWRNKRIKRLEELNEDLAYEVDRLWHLESGEIAA